MSHDKLGYAELWSHRLVSGLVSMCEVGGYHVYRSTCSQVLIKYCLLGTNNTILKTAS